MIVNMHTLPIQGNPDIPLISILVFNYDGHYLRQCLESIFQQDIISNFEVVIIDDASNDGSWDTILEYARNYPGLMTINRNRNAMGPRKNFDDCSAMAKGMYYALLTHDQAFLPQYVKDCVRAISLDPFVSFRLVRHASKLILPAPSIMNSPLVSLCVYNYNYGRYLRDCLESAFAQTYENIEVVFSDNASTDDSWNIALEYARKYPDKMTLTRNRTNFGSDDNLRNCHIKFRGKYLVNLCSDDALAPEFVERCVNAMEAHPDAGYVMVHRAILDAQGNRTEEAPFYNQSCLIPGEKQAGVYMVAAVNPSISQIMYSALKSDGKSAEGGIAARWYGTRILDFNICCENPMLYIKDPLLLHRIHSQNDSSAASEKLLEVIGPFLLFHQFAEKADLHGLKSVSARLPESVEKLGKLCLRYSVRFLSAKNEINARKYYHLAQALLPEVEEDPTFHKLSDYWAADPVTRMQILGTFESTDNLATRTVSYDPPEGSIPIAG